MSELDLSLENDSPVFRPGDLIRGEASWDLKRDAAWIELRLLWYTKGKGDRDFAVVDQARIEHPARSGWCTFELRMPASPYTYHGRYLSILWALELVADRHRRAARAELTLFPEGYDPPFFEPSPLTTPLPSG